MQSRRNTHLQSLSMQLDMISDQIQEARQRLIDAGSSRAAESLGRAADQIQDAVNELGSAMYGTGDPTQRINSR